MTEITSDNEQYREVILFIFTYLVFDTGGGTWFVVAAAITTVAVAVVKTLVGGSVKERYCRRFSSQKNE